MKQMKKKVKKTKLPDNFINLVQSEFYKYNKNEDEFVVMPFLHCPCCSKTINDAHNLWYSQWASSIDSDSKITKNDICFTPEPPSTLPLFDDHYSSVLILQCLKCTSAFSV